MMRGFKQFGDENFELAYANFDWVGIVGRRDWYEYLARTHVVVCLWLGGRAEESEAAWGDLLAEYRPALVFRAGIAEQLEALGYTDAVPGDEPTDLDEIRTIAPEIFEAAPE